ncbi:MAG TPA: hypothetical protein DDZ81_00890 [Acetobacteraceae bacterium]|nr:hypothetical protein [Acetobacteraceae bacterium]
MGAVRKDYREAGNAGDYFKHDQATSRAYRWSEHRLGGISDEGQRLYLCKYPRVAYPYEGLIRTDYVRGRPFRGMCFPNSTSR